MTTFSFVRCETQPRNLVNRGPVTGPFYALMSNSIPLGWVCRGEDGTEWLAWNAYGDFWTGYGETRNAAAAGMLDANWSHFIRDSLH